MKALLLKDCLVVVKQLRVFLVIIPLFALTAIDSMVIFAVLLGAALSMTAFAYDERSGWGALARMMPYTQFELIFSKYLLSYLGILCTSTLLVIGQFIAKMMNKGSLHDVWDILWIAVTGALLFTAFQMPIVFQFGMEKARLVYFVSMGLAGASGTLLQEAESAFVMRILNVSPIVWLAVAVACNLLSVSIALKLKKHKA